VINHLAVSQPVQFKLRFADEYWQLPEHQFHPRPASEQHEIRQQSQEGQANLMLAHPPSTDAA
jgi:hypothetical protein